MSKTTETQAARQRFPECPGCGSTDIGVMNVGPHKGKPACIDCDWHEGKATLTPGRDKPPFRTLAQARKVAAAITAIDGRPRAIIRQEARGDFAVRVGVPCQLGADDRLVEWSGPVTHVTRIDVCGRAPTWRFRYVCSCGWAGDKRRVQMTAERDGTLHEAAMAGQAQARAIERRAAKPAPVPQDPENRRRAASARKAMNAGGYTDDAEHDVSDILCDLQHYADANGIDWRLVTARADDNWRAERACPAESASVPYPAPAAEPVHYYGGDDNVRLCGIGETTEEKLQVTCEECRALLDERETDDDDEEVK